MSTRANDLQDIDLAETVAAKKALSRQLYIQVIVAIILGVGVGYFFPAAGLALKPFGDAFIKLIKMVIPLIIFVNIVIGIAGVPTLGRFGRVAGQAFLYFFVVSTVALLIGLFVGNVVQPGAGLNIDPATLDAGSVSEFAQRSQERTVTTFLMSMIPTTLVSAFVEGNILQALIVSIAFGVGLTLTRPHSIPVLKAMEAVSPILFALIALIMRLAPIGVFGAMAFTVAKYGLWSLVSLAGLVTTFYLTSALFVAVVLGTIASACGFSLWKLIRYLRAELLLVLGTSSSEAAMPALMRKLEEAGCSKPVVGLVLPTGYSFNLDGSNIYITLAALFIAQACNIPLTWQDQVLLLGVAMVSSKGTAGVVGAGFVTLAATLTIVPTIPVAGMALLLGIERFMGQCCAITNYIGNAVATIVVSRWDDSLDKDKLQSALNKIPSQ